MNDASSISPLTLAEAAYLLAALVFGYLGGVSSHTKNLAFRGAFDARQERMAALMGGMVGMLVAILTLWKTNNKLLGLAAAIGGGLFSDEIVALVPGYLKGAADWIAQKIGFKPAPPPPDDPPEPPYQPPVSGPERKAP